MNAGMHFILVDDCHRLVQTYVHMPTFVKVSHLRENLKSYMEKVQADHEPLFLDGYKAVILSVEDYESLQETSYLLVSPKNAKWLKQSLNQTEKGKTITINNINDLDVIVGA